MDMMIDEGGEMELLTEDSEVDDGSFSVEDDSDESDFEM